LISYIYNLVITIRYFRKCSFIRYCICRANLVLTRKKNTYFLYLLIDDSYYKFPLMIIQFRFLFFLIAYSLSSLLDRPRFKIFLTACNRSGIIAFTITFTVYLIYDHEMSMTPMSRYLVSCAIIFFDFLFYPQRIKYIYKYIL